MPYLGLADGGRRATLSADSSGDLRSCHRLTARSIISITEAEPSVTHRHSFSVGTMGRMQTCRSSTPDPRREPQDCSLARAGMSSSVTRTASTPYALARGIML